jgi:hypothetical protein
VILQRVFTARQGFGNQLILKKRKDQESSEWKAIEWWQEKPFGHISSNGKP